MTGAAEKENGENGQQPFTASPKRGRKSDWAGKGGRQEKVAGTVFWEGVCSESMWMRYSKQNSSQKTVPANFFRSRIISGFKKARTVVFQGIGNYPEPLCFRLSFLENSP